MAQRVTFQGWVSPKQVTCTVAGRQTPVPLPPQGAQGYSQATLLPSNPGCLPPSTKNTHTCHQAVPPNPGPYQDRNMPRLQVHPS